MPPDLKGTLGTLIRTTINQVGAMTDVARRQARTQKQRLDTALLERRRREALAELGENLYDLATRGEIELDELPELVRGVQAVDLIDQEIAEAEHASSAVRRPVRLERTRDDRIPPAGRSRERVWRPPVDPVDNEAAGPDDAGTPHADVARGDSRDASGDGDSFDAEFAVDRRTAASAGKQGGEWARTRARARAAADTTPERPKRKAAATTARGGGIVFVDDGPAAADRDPEDSLESYMNEDDVPRRR
jgi:hypothetical protein